jgi:hypothetical protein
MVGFGLVWFGRKQAIFGNQFMVCSNIITAHNKTNQKKTKHIAKKIPYIWRDRLWIFRYKLIFQLFIFTAAVAAIAIIVFGRRKNSTCAQNIQKYIY